MSHVFDLFFSRLYVEFNLVIFRQFRDEQPEVVFAEGAAGGALRVDVGYFDDVLFFGFVAQGFVFETGGRTAVAGIYFDADEGVFGEVDLFEVFEAALAAGVVADRFEEGFVITDNEPLFENGLDAAAHFVGARRKRFGLIFWR